ncbi:MAG: hypothetical protein HGB00_00600 [Chlorobiaceae bacterium]|nr:hypothetical protein [Chlorobiaceae bacterium]
MKKHIHDRYERTADGRLVIDVSASKVEELYEDFDKKAPYHKKDLDEDLTHYLTECVREIGRVDFVIRFTLDTMPAEELKDRVRTSLNRFFMYQRELEMSFMRKMVRKSLVFFMLGIILLVFSLWFAGYLPGMVDSPFMRSVLVEGLTIAAWVSLWESLATLLVEWRPFRQQIRLNYRIAAAPVLFHATARHLRA